MTLEDVIMELYRLAEVREWDGAKTDEALASAIEGMEKIWELRRADQRRSAATGAQRRQPRIWC